VWFKDHSFGITPSDRRLVDVIARTRSKTVGTGLAIAVVLTCFLYVSVPASGSARTQARAGAALVERNGEPKVQARLLLRQDGPRRARVGVLFDLAPGWHLYWRNSGDTGLPPELAWTIPGSKIGAPLWPAPQAFQAPTSGTGIQSYGYKGRVLLAADTTLAEEPGLRTRVAVDADVLVCEAECVPAKFRLERTLGDLLPSLSEAEERAVFTDFDAKLPRPADAHQIGLEATYSRSVIRPGDSFEATIAVRSPNAAGPGDPGDTVAFFPDDHDPIEMRVTGTSHEGERHLISLAGVADPDEPIQKDRLSGVITLTSRQTQGRTLHIEVDLPLPTQTISASSINGGTTTPGTTLGGTTELGLLHALLLALVGGLVLNLMPCVLPILAIKIFSISEMANAAQGGRAEPLRHGVAYTSGILLSMATLGTSVVALRAAGYAVGWGFQFQEPIYVAAICAVLVAFALNLFGVFEIRAGVGALGKLGQDATGARRSFFEGLLAVALATPCSAPFLGTAVGFAFASEPAVIIAIFLAVGIGLAAPFALVTAVPAWARFVPRSGSWMQVVRSGLGFALLATGVWLLWIYGGATGTTGIVRLIVFLLALAFSLWCFGLLQRSDHPRIALAAGLCVIVLGAAGLNAVNAEIDRGDDISREAAPESSGWRTWSRQAVESALERGAPVFVRFTADWCITCKVNEKLVLNDGSMLAAFERGGFERFVADWTQRDEAIRSELARYGRAGVPLYLVYHPSRPDQPELLPELLTLEATLGTIRQVAGSGPRD
jgi:thiol:disulfide interchange protein/DsbC/DsbD-like thiol-disulfide interchange protein